jgi:hypothetical protein
MNFDFERAKRLKDAGFPQPNPEEVDDRPYRGAYIRDPETNDYSFSHDRYAYEPTLDELIEECPETLEISAYESGVCLFALKRSGIHSEDALRWFAGYERQSDRGMPFLRYGPTRKEAVEELWLAWKIVSNEVQS